MSEERRIVLWRRAIFLFRKFKGSEGAFHKAGFVQFRIEQKIIGLSENKPDIISWRTGEAFGEDAVLIIELTLNDRCLKHDQLSRYSGLEPKQLNPLGISAATSPDVILATAGQTDIDCGFCHIILGGILLCEGLDRLHDDSLADSLKDSEKMDLIRIPSTQFTIVPESKFMEIRRGISSILLQMFSPSVESFTANAVTDTALDILADHMDSKTKEKIVSEVETQIANLAASYLKDYIECKEHLFILTEKGRAVHKSPKSMEKVTRQINAWMYEKSLTSYLDDFVDNTSDE